jgi:chromosome segregation ATPase
MPANTCGGAPSPTTAATTPQPTSSAESAAQTSTSSAACSELKTEISALRKAITSNCSATSAAWRAHEEKLDDLRVTIVSTASSAAAGMEGMRDVAAAANSTLRQELNAMNITTSKACEEIHTLKGDIYTLKEELMALKTLISTKPLG